eukprot:355368-Chlamydomonas_euryale.AAC.12
MVRLRKGRHRQCTPAVWSLQGSAPRCNDAQQQHARPHGAAQEPTPGAAARVSPSSAGHGHSPGSCCYRRRVTVEMSAVPRRRAHTHLLRGAHALEEARECVPVVEHEVAHAQKRDLLQPTRPRRPAKRRVRNAVERIVIIPVRDAAGAAVEATVKP